MITYSSETINGCTLSEFGIKIVADEDNPKAVELAKRLSHLESDHPELIVVLGGDGHMLRTVVNHLALRRPFLGLNAGHLGFLLNEAESMLEKLLQPQLKLNLLTLPLLEVEIIQTDGKRHSTLAFNDAWVERQTAQTAWIDFIFNGTRPYEKVVGDALLVATPAGSSAYARNLGAAVKRLDSPELIIVGSAIGTPRHFPVLNASFKDHIVFKALDPKKRPLRGCVDVTMYENVASMSIRASPMVRAQLAFDPRSNLSQKIIDSQSSNI